MVLWTRRIFKKLFKKVGTHSFFLSHMNCSYSKETVKIILQEMSGCEEEVDLCTGSLGDVVENMLELRPVFYIPKKGSPSPKSHNLVCEITNF